MGAAFNHVTGRDRASEFVEVVSRPAVVPCCRPTHDCSVGRSTRNDDVGTLVECIDDAPTSQVCIGGEEVGFLDWLAGFEMPQLIARKKFAHTRHQVVAAHVRDLRVKAEFLGECCDVFCTGVGVEPPGIGHDLDPFVEAGAHDLFHLGHEGSRITAVGPLHSSLREDQHGEFRQPVPGQNVDGSAFDHFACRRKTVTKKARAVCNTNRIGHVSSPFPWIMM